MGQRHRGRLAEREGRRRKHQQRRSPAELRLARDPRGLQAAVGPDAVNNRQLATDFLAGNLHDTTLLISVQEATSVEWALIVIADSPGTDPTSRRWARKLVSSIDRSSRNGSSTAGITP